MDNFNSVLIFTSVILLIIYVNYDGVRPPEESVMKSANDILIDSKREAVTEKIMDVCHNVQIDRKEDCYQQLYPITLPYVNYNKSHTPPEFADSPCLV